MSKRDLRRLCFDDKSWVKCLVGSLVVTLAGIATFFNYYMQCDIHRNQRYQ